jgi:hypothetical protein
MKTQSYAAALAVSGVLSLAGAVAAPVWADGDGGGQDKVGVCHRTASESNPYVYISVPADEANGHITGTDKQHNQQVTWKTDGTWRGVAHKAGDLRLDYLASSPNDCEDTTPTTTPTPTPTTSTPTTTPTTPTTAPTTAPTTPTTAAPTTTPPATAAPTTAAPTTAAPSVTVSPSTAATTGPGGGNGGGGDGKADGGGAVEVLGQQATTGQVTEQQPVPTAINAGASASTTKDEMLLPLGLATFGVLCGLLAVAVRRRA